MRDQGTAANHGGIDDLEVLALPPSCQDLFGGLAGLSKSAILIRAMQSLKGLYIQRTSHCRAVVNSSILY